MRIRLKQFVLCRLLNLHVGYPEAQPDGSMMFYCTRCDSLNHPINPERTEAITREMYREEDYDYEELHP